ncbi:phenylalanine--tRNA ligase subunit beta [Micrococcales bacterium 31B]|nr:phenylalanine--tRNA ligase subunit beta [Micrococcales bacterium 31B]
MPLVPLSWLGEHVDLGATDAVSVAAALVKVGLEEEAIHGAQVTGPLVVGRVLALVKEPQKNGKTINWVRLDVGPEHNDPQADENVKGGLPGEPAPSRGIVCGAHNFVAGDLVVACLPGAVLPGPFPIAARKTYGHVSDGMICSSRELGLGDEHDGIIVLDPARYPDAQPGDDAIALLGLGEEVVEINVTPDRGYCFSMRGVAREYGHSTGAAFTDYGTPQASGRPAVPTVATGTADAFEVLLEDAAPVRGLPGCDRFVARIVRGVNGSQPSPEWMQRRLTLAGMRPISLAVDVSNYVMLDLGQPTHCYDLATLTAPIVVRRAEAGERFTTLDGTERSLFAEDLLITDSTGGHARRVIGIAGVMGGQDSEISDTTTDILVEAAHFAPVSIARASRRHRLSSEASKRFERGVDPQLPLVAAQRIVNLLVEYGGGTADPQVTDAGEVAAPVTVTLPFTECERLIGMAYSHETILDRLRQIGCRVSEADAGAAAWQVTVPSWRPDLVRAADLVEEVARLVGYDEIPSIVPQAPGGRGLTRSQRARRAIASALAENGLDEVLTYPFVAPGLHDTFGVPADDPRRHAVRLANPISSEEPEMRTSVLGTLVAAARRNLGRGADHLAIFEIGQVTRKRGEGVSPILPVEARPSDAELEALMLTVPEQPRHVAGLLSGQRTVTGALVQGRDADWLDAIEIAEHALAAAGVHVQRSNAEYAPWHPGRCAALSVDGVLVGHAGELHPAVVRELGLAPRTVAFEFEVDAAVAAAPDVVEASPLRTFPVSKEDLAVVVDASVPAADVQAALARGAGDVLESIRLFDVFESEALGEGKKSLAFALRFRAADRTLTARDTADARAAALAEAASLGAVLR